jgi:hypothetical protein
MISLDAKCNAIDSDAFEKGFKFPMNAGQYVNEVENTLTIDDFPPYADGKAYAQTLTAKLSKILQDSLFIDIQSLFEEGKPLANRELHALFSSGSPLPCRLKILSLTMYLMIPQNKYPNQKSYSLCNQLFPSESDCDSENRTVFMQSYYTR